MTIQLKLTNRTGASRIVDVLPDAGNLVIDVRDLMPGVDTVEIFRFGKLAKVQTLPRGEDVLVLSAEGNFLLAGLRSSLRFDESATIVAEETVQPVRLEGVVPPALPTGGPKGHVVLAEDVYFDPHESSSQRGDGLVFGAPGARTDGPLTDPAALVNAGSVYVRPESIVAAQPEGPAGVVPRREADRTPPAPPRIDPVAGHDVVNAQARESGVTVAGHAEPGATVTVAWGAVLKRVVADAQGRWSVGFAGAELPGDGVTALNVVATDAAGNASRPATRLVQVDSQAPAMPRVEPIAGDDTVNLAEATAGVVVGGSAEPGATVVMEWGGCRAEVRADATGQWRTTVAAAQLGADGASVLTATARDAAGNLSPAVTRTVRIDRSAPGAPSIDVVGAHDMVNASAKAAGVAMSGRAEAGASVTVAWGAHSKHVVAGADGTWSAVFAAAEVPHDGTVPVMASATDGAGNAGGRAVRTVLVDTLAPAVPAIDRIGSDDVINASERRAGVTVSGSAEPHATIDVSWGGATRRAKVAADGSWEVRFDAGAVPGDGTGSVSVVAIDAAGNTSAAATRTVRVDTSVAAPAIAAIAGDNVVNAAEKERGVVVSGTAEPGSTVEVTWAGTGHRATASADGTWQVRFAATEIPADGRYAVSAVATDSAGNISRPVQQQVVVATSTSLPTIDPISGDDVVSAAERRGGVDVSGSASPGASVTVTWGMTSHVVTADASGRWQASFAQGEIPVGTTDVTVVAVDSAGNASAMNVRSVAVRPAEGALALAAESDSGVVGDAITNCTAPVVRVTLSGAAEGDVLEIKCDGRVVGSIVLSAAQALAGQAEVAVSGLGADGAKLLTAELGAAGAPPALLGTLAFELDTAAPGQPGLALSPASDTGASPNDHVTSDRTPTMRVDLAGTGARAGDRVLLMWEGAMVGAATLSADDLAAMVVEITAADLGPAGTRLLHAVLVDAAGNSSARSEPVRIELQQAPLAPPAIALDPASDSGSSSSDGITNIRKPVFSVALAATGAQRDDIVRLECNGEMVLERRITQAEIDAGQITITDLDLGGDGTKVLTATLSNAVGSSGPSAPIVVELDTAAPAPPEVTAQYTADAMPVINGRAVLADGEVLTVEVNGAMYRVDVDLATGQWTLDLGQASPMRGTLGAFESGKTYEVAATVTDRAGNTAVDNQSGELVIGMPGAPSQAVTISAMTLDSGSSAGDFITNDGQAGRTVSGTISAALGANEVVQVSFDGGASWSTARAVGTSWTITDAGAHSASWTIQARVTNTLTNVSGAAASQQVTYDADKPATLSVSLAADTGAADGVTSDGALNVSGKEAGCTVQYKLDNGTWSETYTPAEGTHTVYVRQVDVAGNVSDESSLTYTLDTTAPAAPTVDALTTSELAPVLTGTATLPAGETLSVTVNGATYTVVPSGGNWTLDLATATPSSGTLGSFAFGQNYEVVATVTDLAGNTSADNSATELQIVLPNAPTQTVIIAAMTLDSGSSAGDFITNDGQAGRTVSGTISAALGANEVVQVSFDGGTTWSTASTVGISWTITDAGAHSASWTIQARVTNTLTNASGAAASQLVTYDADKPATLSVSLAADTGAADGVTSSGALNVSGQEAGCTVQYKLDNGTWSETYTPAEGTHTVYVRQVDVAGNVSDESSIVFTLDTVAPAAPTVDALTTSELAPVLTGTATLAAGETLSVTVNGATYTVVPSGGNWTLDLATATPSSGTLGSFAFGQNYEVVATVTDLAGNTSADNSATELQIVAPNAPTQTVIIAAMTLDSGSSAGDFITNDGQAGRTVSGTISAALGANEVVQVSFDGGTSWSTATTAGTSWTITDTGAHSASWTIQARVTNTSGNVSGAVASKAVTYDADKPATLSVSLAADTGAADGVTSDAALNVSGQEAGCTVQYKLDNGTWSETYTPAEGTHTVYVRQADVAGNVSDESSLTYTLDTTAPAAPTVDALSTSELAPVLTGTATLAAGETLSVTVNGATYTVVPSGGNWTLDLATATPSSGALGALAYGQAYEVTAVVTDLAGNTATDASAGELVLIAPPAQTAVIGAMSFDSGSSAGDFITNDGQAGRTVSGTISAALGANEVVQVSFDGGASWSTASTVGTSWTITDAGAHSASWTIQARVTNTLTNASGAAASQQVTYDADKPATLSVSLAADTGAADGVTLSGALNVSGQEAGCTVQYKLDNGAWSETYTPAEGTHTVYVRQVDVAGNVSDESSLTYTLDTTAPAAPTVDALSTSELAPVLTGTATLAAGETLSVTVNGATYTVVPSGGNWTLDLATATPSSGALGTLAYGQAYEVTAVVADLAGNTATDASAGELVLIAPPAQTAVIGAMSFDSGSSAGDFITNDGQAGRTVSGTISAALGANEVVQVSFDGGASWSTATTVGTSWTITDTGAHSASWTIQARVTNTLTNASGAAVSQQVTYDADKPAMLSVSLAADTGAADGVTSSGALNLSGQEAGCTVQYKLDNGAWSETYTPAEGTHTVYVRQVDVAGNVSDESSIVFTLDTTAPAVPTVDALTTSELAPVLTGTATLAAGETLSVTVNGATYTVVPSGGNWTLDLATATPSSGTLGSFAFGQSYEVVATVTDLAGNTSADGSATELQIVLPNAPTQAVTIAAMTLDSGSSASDFITNDGQAGRTVSGTISAGLGEDEVVEVSFDGGASWSAATTAGTSWTITDAGAHSASWTIQARVTNTSGNVSGAVASKAVTYDADKPAMLSVSLAADTGAADGVTSSGALNVSGQEAGCTVQYKLDNGTWSETYTPAEGTHTVYVRQVDVAGNVSDESSIVFTLDTTAPAAPTVDALSTSELAPVLMGTATLAAGETLSVTVNGATYTVVPSGGNWTLDLATATPSSGTLGTLAYGQAYEVTAVVTDLAGNTATDASAGELVLIAPPAQTAVIGAMSFDSGSSAGDFITNDGQAGRTVSGTISAALGANEVVQVSFDGGASWSTATTVGTSWTITDTGTHSASWTIQARVTNTLTNASGAAASQQVTYDADKPAMLSVSLAADTGAADGVTSSGALNLSGQEAGCTVQHKLDNGAWSETYTPAEGTHTVYLRQVDVAGNVSDESSIVFTLDTVAPAAPTVDALTTSELAPVLTGTATLAAGETLSVTVNGATYTVVPSGGNWTLDLATATPSSGTLGSFAFGQSYEVVATVTDLAGNTSADNSATELQIVLPNAPTQTVIIAAMTLDSGSSASDFITNDGQAGRTVSGTISAGLGEDEVVEVSFDGGASWSTATTAGTSWTITDTGAHSASWTIQARVTNTSGNVSGAVASKAVTYDADKPAMLSVSLAADTGAADGVTSDGALNVSGQEAGCTVQYKLDSGAWSETYTPAEGTHTVYVRQVDVAGNVSDESSLTYTLDTTAPAAPTVDALSTSEIAPVLTGTATLAAGETLSVTVNGATYTVVPSGGNWTLDLATATPSSGALGTLAYGQAYEVTAVVTDLAGNTATDASAGELVLIAPPAQTAVIGAMSFDSGSSAGDFITNDGQAGRTVSGTISAALGANEVVQVSFDGGASWSTATTAGTSWTITDAGTHSANWTIQARVTNTLTNASGAAASQQVTYDADKPATLSVSLAADTGAADGVTSSGALNVSGQEAGCTVQYKLDNGTWSETYTPAEGTHTVYVRQVDVAGNVSDESSIVFTLDTIAPLAPSVNVLATASLAPVLTGTATLAAGETLSVTVNGATYTVAPSGGSWTLDLATATPSSGTLGALAYGQTYEVTAVVTDLAGNSTPDASAGELVLIAPPAQTVAIGAMSQDSGSSAADFITNDGQAGRTVSGTISGALGANEVVQVSFDGGATWSNASTAGTSWSVTDNGAHSASWTIRARVTNTLTNASGTAASQEVTYDADKPAMLSVSLATDTGAADGVTSNGALKIDGQEAGCTVQYKLDNGTWSNTYTPAEGTHTVYVRQVDVAGNTSDESSIVFTLDTMAPVAPTVHALATASLAPVLTGTATVAAGETLSVTVNGATYTVVPSGGAWTLDLATATPTAGTLGPLAYGQTYEVTAKVTDIAGNTATDASAGELVLVAPPAQTAAIAAMSFDSGSSSTDFITNDGRAGRTVSGTIDAPLGANEVVQVSFDGGATWSSASTVGTNWSVTDTSAHSASWTIQARVTNTLTNASAATASRAVTYDPDMPATLSVSLAADTGSAVDGVTSNGALNVSGQEAGCTVQYKLDNGVWSETYTPTEGTHTVYVRQVDVAGNASDATSIVVTLDTTAPVAPTVDALATASLAPVLSGTAALAAGETLGVTVNGATYTVVPSGGNWTLDLAAATPVSGVLGAFVYGQTYEVTAVITDLAGNTATDASAGELVLVAPPAQTVTIGAMTFDSGSSSTDFITNDGRGGRSVTGTVSAPLGANEVVQVSFDGGATWSNASTAGTSWSATDSGAHSANWTIKARVTNTVVNISGAAASQAVTYDALKPAMLSVSLATDTGAADGVTSNGALKIDGQEAGCTVQYKLDNGTWSDTYTPAEGTHTVYVRQVDVAGNTSDESSVVVTLDTIAPTAPTVEPLATASLAPTLSGTASLGTGETLTVTVNGATYTVVPGGGSWTLDLATATPSSGVLGALAHGQTYEVTATVTDIAGNTTTDASAGELVLIAPPAQTVTIGAMTFDSGSSATDFITNDGHAGRTVSGAISAVLGANEVVQVSFDGGASWFTASTAGTSWSVTDGGPHSASWTIQARVTNVLANASGATASQAVTYDTTPPAALSVALVSDTGDNSDKVTRNPALNVTGVENGATVQYSSDGTTWTGSYTAVQGQNSVWVRQTDVAGNTWTAAAPFTFTYDTVDPGQSVTIADLRNDMGTVVAPGGRTNDNKPTLSGTLDVALGAAERIAIYDNGVFAGYATTLSATSWTFTPGTSLADGGHSFTARVVDGAGNMGPLSGAYAVTLDTQPPAAPTIDVVAGDNTVNGAEKAAGVVIQGTGEANGTVTVTWGGVTRTAAVNGSGRWAVSYGPGDVPADGTTSVVATITDTAGNVGAARSATVRVSSTAPDQIASITTLTNDNPGGPKLVPSGTSTNDPTPALAGELDKALQAGQSVLVYDGATLLGTAVPVANSLGWTFSITGAGLSDGNHKLRARVVDADGNMGALSPVPFDVTIDTANPVQSAVITDALDDATNSIAAGAWTKDNQPQLRGTLSASLEAGEYIAVFSGTTYLGTATVGAYNGSAWQWQFTPPSALADGTHALSVAVMDAAGNKGTTSPAYSVKVDTVAPTQYVTLGQAYDDYGTSVGYVPEGGTTNDNELALSGTISAPLGSGESLLIYDVANGVTSCIGTATVAGGGTSWSLVTPLLSNAVHTFYGQVQDAAGNVGEVRNPLTITINSVPPAQPTINDVATDNRVNASEKNTVAVTGTADAGSTVVVSWAGVQRTVTASALGVWSASYANAFTYPTGLSSTVAVFAMNAEGTRSTVATKAVEIDTLAPTAKATLTGLVDDYGNSKGIITTTTTTDDRSLLVEGTLSAALAGNEVVTVYDGTVSIGVATLTGATTWRFQTSDLTTDTHTFTAYVEDSGGNKGPVSNAISARVSLMIQGTDIVAGDGGFVLDYPIATSNRLGQWVSPAHDVNGDGLDDFLVAVPGQGKNYVVFGTTANNAIALNKLSSAGNGVGFVFNLSTANAGEGFSGIGDVNGDGLADFMVNVLGSTYVVYGKTGDAPIAQSSIPTSGTAAGSSGFVINGGGSAGRARVASAGDVNGDGLQDIIMGNESSGKNYVLFGRTSGTNVAATSIGSTVPGFSINQEFAGDGAGFAVAGAGDVNGDGLDDVLVSSRISSAGGVGPSAGRTYVVFGKTGNAPVSLSAVVQGEGGFAISGAAAGDWSGYSISGGGDVNGDGLADIIVAARSAGDSAGRAYVVFGKTDTAGVSLGALGAAGFTLFAEPSYAYSRLSAVYSAGDINGDGIDDLLVGAEGQGTTAERNFGAAYVVFGKPGISDVQLSEVAYNVGGFGVWGNEYNALFGVAVSPAGDIDGDGLTDLLVGAKGTSDVGKVFVLTSSDAEYRERTAITQWGTAGADPAIHGTSGDDNIAAGAGNDVVYGNGGKDVILGGAGDDNVVLTTDNVIRLSRPGIPGGRVVGGLGVDTLTIADAGVTLDFDNLHRNAIQGIERIDLGGKGNMLKLSFTDLNDIHDPTRHQLVIDGTSDDTVVIGAGNWTSTGTVVYNANTYTVYTQGPGIEKLLVEVGITVT